jgi:hypothetical protein
VYEKFMSIYNETDAFKKGTLTSFDDPDVAIFTRTLNDETYLVMVNVRNTTKEVTFDSSIQNTSWNDRLNDTSVTLTDKITIPPYGYLVLKRI